MRRLGISTVLVLTVIASIPILGFTAEEAPMEAENEWATIPFRVRDLTFPTVLVLGFMPRPNETLEPGQLVLEFNFSASNNFQASEGVQHYLERRGGTRRPLDRNDIDTMLRELNGDQFLFDGEFNLFDLGLHFGLSDRLVGALRFSYLTYGGGFLDDPIYRFHDTVGLGQAGRNFVSADGFQLFYMGAGAPQPFSSSSFPNTSSATRPTLNSPNLSSS